MWATRSAVVFLTVCFVLSGCASADSSSNAAEEPSIELLPEATSEPSDESTAESPSSAEDSAESTTTPDTTAAPAAPTIPLAEIQFESLNDPYYPAFGNAGYDVAHYDLTLSIDVDGADTFIARARIDLAPTDELQALAFDLADTLEVETVTVEGVEAEHLQEDGKLLIKSPAPLAAYSSYRVEVAYGGNPTVIESGTRIGPIGWYDGPTESVTVGEPFGAHTWFPVNDHPSDKATYTFRLDSPLAFTPIANGELLSNTATDERRFTVWEMRQPMASYLAVVGVGDFELVEEETDSGIDLLSTVTATDAPNFEGDFGLTDEMMDVFTELFGPYPFESYGALVSDVQFGFALETQGRSLFSSRYIDGDGSVERIVAHELAHQWFGNHVTPEDWSDIWLNEGFAAYAEVLWFERSGHRTLESEVARLSESNAANPTPAPGDPGGGDLFAPSVYQRGGSTLHALRLTVGDDAFFTILRQWSTRFGGGNASTADLIALSEEISGQELDDLFAAWLGDGPVPQFP